MNSKIIKIIIGVIAFILLLVGINYIMINKVVFSLIGNKEIQLNVNDTWNDKGFNISNESLRNKVKITNNVNTSKEGTYEVNYTLKRGIFSKSLTRTIKVLGENEDSGFTFKLNGDNPYYLLYNNQYSEPGFSAIDSLDGDITNNVIVTNEEADNHEIIYTITNSQGVTKTLKREVFSYAFNFIATIKTRDPAQSNEINIDINDENYDYTILPNNEKTTRKQIEYGVIENNKYTFVLYDKQNNSFQYDAVIDNIDREPPVGTCSYTLSDNSGIITVTAKDDNEIQGYKYSYGKNETELLTENTYTVNTLDDNASVTIYDKANNSVKVDCKTEDNSSSTKRNYTLNDYTWNNNKYRFWKYIPNNLKRTKYPLVVYLRGDHLVKTDPNNINKYGFTKHVKEGEDYPFYMISPYCSHFTDYCSRGLAFYGEGGLGEAVVDMVNYMIKNYNIDTNRIILIGEDSGGDGAYLLASTHKDMFSCAIIDEARGFSYNQKLTYLKLVNPKSLINTPLWIFQAKENAKISFEENDKNVNITLPYSRFEEAKKYADEITAAGGNVKFTPIEGSGENNENTIYRNQELINWMLSQKKK